MTITSHLVQGSNGEHYYRDSIVTPGYWQKKAKGLLLPDNPFTLIRREWHQPRVPYYLNNGVLYDITHEGFTGMAPFEVYSRLTNSDGLFGLSYGTTVPGAGKLTHQVRSIYRQRTDATNKLSKKLNSRDIDLGVALAEARETAHYVQTAMIKTFVVMKNLSRGKVSQALRDSGLTRTTRESGRGRQQLREVADAAAGTQLSLEYALKPLLADVFGAVTALEKRHSIPWIKTVRASVSDELDIHLFNTNVKLPNDQSSGVTAQFHEYSGGYTTRAALTFQVDNPFTYTLSQLGLLNPLELVWEATRLSFVVDWFVPIGDWFAGLVPPQGVSVVSGHVTTGLRARSKAEVLYRTEANLGRRTVVIPCRHEESYKWRQKLTSFPRYHIVGADFSLSQQQVMSGISLLWSFGAGRKSEAKAYNDAVALNSRGYSSNAGNMSREKWGGSPFPMSYARL